MGAPATVLWDVVEEHLDEAAFLAARWEDALNSPRWTVAALAGRVEDRLRAHLDGLQAAGAAARARLLEPALGRDDPWVVFTAALALLETGEPVARVAALLGAGNPRVDAALTRSLELARRSGIEAELLALATEGDVRSLPPALAALAFRRAPVPAELVARVASHGPAAAMPAALRAARLAGPRAIPLLEWAVRSDVPAIRDAALETGLVLGLRAAWTVCQRLVDAGAPDAGRALLALGLGGDPDDAERLALAASVEVPRPAALFALGFTGRASAADACLTHLRDPTVARLAGEAFSAITGLVLEREFRSPEPPPPDEPIPLEQEDLDADLVPRAESALPLPAADAIEAWWKGARSRFDPRGRYLRGTPVGAEAVRTALREGPLRRRHALGLELAIRSKGAWALQTRGWAADQLHEEARLAFPRGPELGAPFERLMTL